ncbi:MAG: hypothetical protein M3M94_03450 [Actinomycetota bacterium]|nr:hypothetical protein [Actinomycetota bacterium]
MRKRIAAAAAILGALLTAGAGSAHTAGTAGDVRAGFGSPFLAFPAFGVPSLELVQARMATVRFRSVAEAVRAGYVPGSPCVSSPAGGMGIHYENRALMADPVVDVTRPEILLYEPTARGLRLVGLEYWKADADQNPGTTGDRPSLFGRSFDGPMPGHNPVMPMHYDLHVWIWKPNPLGRFAPFNPRVTCPA